MLLTILTFAIIAVLIVLVGLRLKRSAAPQQAIRRRPSHQEPHVAEQQAPTAITTDEHADDTDDALGLQPIHSTTTKATQPIPPIPVEYMTLHVIAPREYPYGGYELLQALLASGLRYGDKHIFHRHETKTGRGAVLFSLASINKPGTFELTKMGNFTCPGLTLFMLLKREVDPMLAFDTMLETARQLAEDLGGEVWDDQRRPLNMDKVAELRAKIRHFEETQRMPDFFDNAKLASQVSDGDRF